MRPQAFLPAIVLCLLLAPLPARADVVVLQTSVTVTAGAGELTATAQVANVGDAAAFDLIARMALLDLRLASPEQKELGVQKSFSFLLHQEVPDLPRGSFPLVLLMEYTDETGYPLSALHCGAFDTPGARPARIEVQCEKAELADNAAITASVQNDSDRALDITSTLYLPREILSKERRNVFLVKPGERRSVTFDLKNLTALPGSEHSVFVAFEY
ncbi:MAG: hypothetical protein AB1921_11765, partial [Thermodesulfobacteriota bacterium]